MPQESTNNLSLFCSPKGINCFTPLGAELFRLTNLGCRKIYAMLNKERRATCSSESYIYIDDEEKTAKHSIYGCSGAAATPLSITHRHPEKMPIRWSLASQKTGGPEGESSFSLNSCSQPQEHQEIPQPLETKSYEH